MLKKLQPDAYFVILNLILSLSSLKALPIFVFNVILELEGGSNHREKVPDPRQLLKNPTLYILKVSLNILKCWNHHLNAWNN